MKRTVSISLDALVVQSADPKVPCVISPVDRGIVKWDLAAKKKYLPLLGFTVIDDKCQIPILRQYYKEVNSLSEYIILKADVEVQMRNSSLMICNIEIKCSRVELYNALGCPGWLSCLWQSMSFLARFVVGLTSVLAGGIAIYKFLSE